jgi:hypothetical protein
MRNKLFRLAAVLAVCLSGYGALTTQVVRAQCGCACTWVCPNTCNFSCDGCDLNGLIETASKCCSAAKADAGCRAPMQ